MRSKGPWFEKRTMVKLVNKATGCPFGTKPPYDVVTTHGARYSPPYIYTEAYIHNSYERYVDFKVLNGKVAEETVPYLLELRNRYVGGPKSPPKQIPLPGNAAQQIDVLLAWCEERPFGVWVVKPMRKEAQENDEQEVLATDQEADSE